MTVPQSIHVVAPCCALSAFGPSPAGARASSTRRRPSRYAAAALGR